MTENIFPDSFTVLLPTFNRPDLYELFDMAVNSIYANTILPYETIVVVDGPVTPLFEKKIIEYKRRYNLKVLWLKENKGLATALNIGLEHVRTKWVFRADGDDYNLPTRFESQLPYLLEGYDLVGSNITEVDNCGRHLHSRVVPLTRSSILSRMKSRSPFNHMTVAYNAHLVKELGSYPDLYLKEDYALWARILGSGANCINLDKILVYATAGTNMYRRRAGFKYLKSELDLQRFLIQCNVTSVRCAILFGILRSLIFISPNFVRGFVYVHILRMALK